MTTLPTTPPTPESPPPAPPAMVSLRLRLWIACFAGALVAGGGVLWVLGTQWLPGEGDLSPVFNALSIVAGASLLAGFACALWLDTHIVAHLRGVLLGIQTGRVAALRGLPGAMGWGELSELTDGVQGLLSRQRQSQRATEELEATRVQLESLRESLEHWRNTERWQGPGFESGAAAALEATLARGFTRSEQVGGQNREVARQIAADLAATLGDAQASAEQAERGFVEATALLTTVRELQRLSLELRNSLTQIGTSAPDPGTGADERYRESARSALEELVRASTESVASITASLLHVQEIAEGVQRLGNRATLIAIHAVVGGPRGGDDVLGAELRQLATDVRQATERTTELASEIEREVAKASERMRGVRERTLSRLESEPPPIESPERQAGAERRAWDDSTRLLERVREMVQDAAKKGERLSATGERASRAAERLARRLEEETREAEALAVRLEPVGDAFGTPADSSEGAVASGGLRVVEMGVASAPRTSDEAFEPGAGDDSAESPNADDRPEESR